MDLPLSEACARHKTVTHVKAAAMASSDMKGTSRQQAVRMADAVAGPTPCHQQQYITGS